MLFTDGLICVWLNTVISDMALLVSIRACKFSKLSVSMSDLDNFQAHILNCKATSAMLVVSQTQNTTIDKCHAGNIHACQ